MRDNCMAEPRVAILLPVYNRAWCLSETIDALNAQSFRDFVVIAVDDCSPDTSYDLLQGVSQADSGRWQVSRNKVNLGVYANGNRCLQLQREFFPNVAYVVKVDSDDVLDPDLIATGVAALGAA